MTEIRGNPLGEFLDKWLKDKGMKPYALSQQMGVSHSTIRAIINGDSKHPTNRILESLSRHMNVEFHILADLSTPKATHERSAESMLIADIYEGLDAKSRKVLLSVANDLERLFREDDGDIEQEG